MNKIQNFSYLDDVLINEDMMNVNELCHKMRSNNISMLEKHDSPKLP